MGDKSVLLKKARLALERDDADAAGHIYRQIIELDFDDLAAHYELVRIYYLKTCRFAEAIYHARRALEINPGFGEARLALAELLMMQGNLSDGFAMFDQSRHLYIDKQSARYRFFQMIPRWRGEIFSGRRLIIGEDGGFGGFGDILFFARYMPLVKARGGYVALPVKRELFRLFNTLDGVDEFLLPSSNSIQPADFDLQIPFASLPVVFGTSLNTIPNSPYLSADPELSAVWKERVHKATGANNTFKVGLVWSSSSYKESNPQHRTCGLSALVPLFKLPGVTFYSLQVGEKADEIAENRDLNIIDLTAEIEDFADTAALIDNLDLVISVDTAVAHLAGAMGKPVWLMVSFISDWKWLLERADSPWYPSMRVFRAKKPGDWGGAVEEIYLNLEAMV